VGQKLDTPKLSGYRLMELTLASALKSTVCRKGQKKIERGIYFPQRGMAPPKFAARAIRLGAEGRTELDADVYL